MKALATVLVAAAILFGVYPQALFNYMTPTIKQQADTLATWTKDVKKPAASGAASTAQLSHSDGLMNVEDADAEDGVAP